VAPHLWREITEQRKTLLPIGLRLNESGTFPI
jgi:hypothetical protein